MLFGGGFPPTAGDGPASARLSVDSKRSPHEFGTKKIPAHLRERLNPVNRLGSPLDPGSGDVDRIQRQEHRVRSTSPQLPGLAVQLVQFKIL